VAAAENFETFFSGRLNQGCQMVCFQTKNPNLGKFRRALDWKIFICIFDCHLEYFMDIWGIL
jgi:hypothetical protein